MTVVPLLSITTASAPAERDEPQTDRVSLLADPLWTRKLTALRAPAGYGKSAALNAIYQRMRALEMPVAYVRLDRRHNGVARFAEAIANAFGLEEGEPSAVSLGERLEVLPPRLLFLEGFDAVSDPQVREMFVDLLHFVEDLHVVMAVRQLDLPMLSRWRARNALEIVGPPQLAFSRTEAIDFLGQTVEPDLLAVIDRTAGWPMLLKLVRDGLAAGDDIGAIGEPGTVSGDRIADFVEEELLEPLDPDDRALLVGTSLVSRFTQDLAQTLLPELNVDGAIERLTRRHGLLTARRDHELWYEVNPMVRRALLRRLTADKGPALRDLHRMVEAWMLDHDAADQAMLHACHARDYAECRDLMRQLGPATLSIRFGLRAIRTVLQSMPQRFTAGDPSFLVSQALLFSKEGRNGDARRLLSELRPLAEGQGEEAVARPTLIDLDLLEIMLLCHADQPLSDETIARLEGIAEETPATDLIRRGWMQNTLCRMYLSGGDLAAAVAAGSAAHQYYAQSNSYYGEFFVHLHIASVRLWQAMAEEVAQHLDMAGRLASRHFADDPTMAHMVQLLRAELRFEYGDEERDRDLAAALQVAEDNDGWLDLFVSGYRTAAMSAHGAGDLDAALALLRRGEEAALRLKLPRLGVIMQITRVELETFAGDRRRAADGLRAIRLAAPGVAAGHESLWRERLMRAVAEARLLIHNNQFKRARAVLEALEAEAEERGAMRIARKAQLLHAILLCRSGSSQNAVVQFAQLLEIQSNPPSFRCYVEEGEAVARLCELLGQSAVRHRLSPHAIGLFEQIGDRLADTGQRMMSPEGVAYLGNRGQQILLRVAEGMSNKEIASQLNITEATVKFHLQAIYRKLGATNRVRAIAVAQEQGLLF